MSGAAGKKVGIIGYGGMGKWHQEKLGLCGCAQAVAVYDIDPSKYEVPAAKDIKKCASLGELLALPLDFVIVSTPNDFHADISKKALAAGKNVLCEKPATMNAAELELVIGAAKDAHRVFSVHQNRRWDKDFRIVKKTYDERILGRPFFIESRMQGANGIPGDWRKKKASGGGMLFDWGVHLIDQVLWMVDSPIVEAYPQLLKVKSDECDDMVKISMKFANGVCALIEVNTFSFIPEWRWHYCADQGTLYIDNLMDVGGAMRRLVREGEQGPSKLAGSGPTRTFAPSAYGSYEELPLPDGVDSDHLNLYRNFIAACDGKAELIVRPEESLRVMRFIDAMFDCAKRGVMFKGEL